MATTSTWIIVLLLIALNGVFVIAEIAIIASKKSKLMTLKDAGHPKNVDLVVRLKNTPEIFISTIQVGITLLNIFIGMFTGKELTDDFANIFSFMPFSDEAKHAISYAIALLFITYLTVLGEVIPKRIGLVYPETIAIRIAKLMLYCSYLFYPIVKLLDISTKAFIRLIRFKDNKNGYISVEEIKFLIKQAKIDGILASTEHDIMRRIVNLNDMLVRSIMVPRLDICVIPSNNNMLEIKEKLIKNPHSFFPVMEDGTEEINGILATKKFFTKEIEDKNHLSKSYVNYIYIPDSAKVTSLIEQLREAKAQVAVVVDEHGSIEGMITINDILKVFINDLAYISEERGLVIKKLRHGFLVHGDISYDEAAELMQIESLLPEDAEPDERMVNYHQTLSSLIMERLGRVAKRGDVVKINKNWIVKVNVVSNFRIVKVSLINTNSKDDLKDV